MTTVVWDGETLSTDTRVTYFDADGKVVKRSDGVTKIIVTEKFHFDGEVAQAVGLCGDLRAISILQHVAQTPEIPPFDLANTDSYTEGGGLHGVGDFGITVVTPTRSALISAIGGKASVIAQPRSEKIAAGSCYQQAITHACLGFRSDEVVGMAMLTDKGTGGMIQTYNPDTGTLTAREYGGFWPNYKNCLKAVWRFIRQGKKK